MTRPDATRRAAQGMVCSVDHAAGAVGVDLLRRGGSAVDAAVGANAVLAVVAPHLCGMGGDLWALVHEGRGEPAALDSAGFAGSGADPDRVRSQGHESIPLRGHIGSVTVPGAVDGWCALHQRFGRLPLELVLAEAIRMAGEGFAATPLLAARGRDVAGVEGNSDIPADLRPGDVLRRPGSARALQAIVDSGRNGFYGGEFGRGLLDLGARTQPPEYLASDLASPIARWVKPLRIEAFGRQLWTVPPPSQGYLTLASAWIADRLDLPDRADGNWAHLLIEAAVAAAHDRGAVLHEAANGADLLDAARLGPRRDAIDPEQASNLAAPAGAGDTTYLCAVDRERLGVSLINSNASGFGAHLVAGTTGIFVHDRGIGFSLEPGHPAEYGPLRRPPHTLSPALVTGGDGRLRMVLGTMGGDAQPQILLQLLDRLLRLGESPGTAVSAPRWALAPAGNDSGFDTWQPGSGRLVVIENPATGWRDVLAARGHATVIGGPDPFRYGHAHVIELTPAGSLAGAADPRALVGGAVGL